MRILLLTLMIPYPLDSGGKIKTYNVLRHLARFHDVHLISFVRSEQEAQNARRLQHLCRAGITVVPLHRSRLRDAAYLVRGLLSNRPFLVERDDLPSMRAAVQKLVDQYSFDAVHADQLSMAHFAVDLSIPLRVLDEHNAVWMIVRRAAKEDPSPVHRGLAELEWRKLRRHEGDVCRRFTHVTVVSNDDRRALEVASGGPLPIALIPIAVDTAELAFQPRSQKARHVLSLATMFYPPNATGVHWFATRSFPRVRARVPGTELLVVGARPPASISRLQTPESGVVVTGYASDLAPLLERSAVLVVPVHSASGMRVKILEAFARGIPVVSTTVGVEGIDALHQEHLLVADDPIEFADAVSRIIMHPELGSRLAVAARELVERRYDWRTALAPLDTIYPPSNPSDRRDSGASSHGRS